MGKVILAIFLEEFVKCIIEELNKKRKLKNGAGGGNRTHE